MNCHLALGGAVKSTASFIIRTQAEAMARCVMYIDTPAVVSVLFFPPSCIPQVYQYFLSFSERLNVFRNNVTLY